MTAARSAPGCYSAKAQLRRPNATPLSARFAELLLRQNLPSSKKKGNPSQRFSI